MSLISLFVMSSVFAQLAGLGIAAILAIIFLLLALVLIGLHAFFGVRPTSVHLGWSGAFCFVVAFAILSMFGV